MVNRGGPGNPLGDEELFLKFRLNAKRCLSAGQIERLAETIRRLDRLENVGAILELARPEEQAT